MRTFVSDEKGKGTNGATMRLKVPMRIQGADWIVVVLRAGESRKERRVQPDSDSLKLTTAIKREDWVKKNAQAVVMV